MTNYQLLDDERLLDLLFTEEDRLPRTAVDEFLRRGRSMIAPLAGIICVEFYWTGDSSKQWAVIHAVYILGAIGGEETILPLARALRSASVHQNEWITEDLPSIFRNSEPIAQSLLKLIASDITSDWYTRSVAMDCLAALTIKHPEIEKEVFPFIHSILVNELEERDVRSEAGCVLMNFRRNEYREDLMAFGREEEWLKSEDEDYLACFYEKEVEEAFSEKENELFKYQKDWLSFYNADEIQKRRERWKEEDKDYSEIKTAPKIGRNDFCPCGSGKKYKKCCLA